LDELYREGRKHVSSCSHGSYSHCSHRAELETASHAQNGDRIPRCTSACPSCITTECPPCHA
jgi:hypothetical protein